MPLSIDEKYFLFTLQMPNKREERIPKLNFPVALHLSRFLWREAEFLKNFFLYLFYDLSGDIFESHLPFNVDFNMCDGLLEWKWFVSKLGGLLGFWWNVKMRFGMFDDCSHRCSQVVFWGSKPRPRRKIFFNLLGFFWEKVPKAT